MNKSESKYFNTALLFDEALIHLLEEKELDYINIKEICQKAGVNRSTFYLHYENINDLVEETMDYINQKFTNYFQETTEDFLQKINNTKKEELDLIEAKYLTPYLTFIKDNKKIFKASFKNPNGMNASKRFQNLKQHIILPILEKLNINKEERDYILDFYISGIIAIIKRWIKNDCTESIGQIENIIIKCVKKEER